MVICDVERDLDCSSDHLPIVTRLMLDTVDSPSTTRRNFNKVDVKILQEILTEEIGTRPCMQGLSEAHNRTTNEEIDAQIRAIIDALHTAVNKSTPLLRISPRSKSDFTPECKEAQTHSKRMKRRWRRTVDEDD